MNNIGNFNFKKYLHNLSVSDGTSILDMIKELVDNSFDANATNIKILFEDKTLIVCDDGYGLDYNSFKKITEFYSTHDNIDNNTSGKFGIGAKKALRGLSDLNEISIISKNSRNNRLLSTTINFKEYNSITDYIGKVKLLENFEKHVDYFNKYKFSEYGTLFLIKTSFKRGNEIVNLMKHNLLDENNLRLNLCLTYHKYLKDKNIFINDEKIINFTFHPNSNEFLNKNYDIEIYENSTNRLIYLFRDKAKNKWIVKPHGSGYANYKIDNNFQPKSLLLGKILIRLSFPKNLIEIVNNDATIIIDKNTKNIPEEQSKLFNYYEEYDKNFIIKENKSVNNYYTFMKNVNIVRNNRLLSTLNFKVPNTGDNWRKNAQKIIFKSLEYSHTLDNIITLVQENKSSVDWKVAPRGLDKLINGIVKDFVDKEIKNEMLKKLDEYKLNNKSSSSSDDNSDDLYNFTDSEPEPESESESELDQSNDEDNNSSTSTVIQKLDPKIEFKNKYESKFLSKEDFKIFVSELLDFIEEQNINSNIVNNLLTLL